MPSSLFTVTGLAAHSNAHEFMHSYIKLRGENTQKVHRSMSTIQGCARKTKDVALKAPRRLEEPGISRKSVAGLPTPCFYADFGVSYHKRVMEMLKCEPKKSFNSQKKFLCYFKVVIELSKRE